MPPRALLPALALLFAAGLPAQAIDSERSRFLTEPHGRTGAYAPFRLVFTARAEVETVEVLHGNVALRKHVAAQPGAVVEALLPVIVSPGVRVRTAGDEIQPRLPARRVESDYSQPYAAVFAADALYVRSLMPTVPGEIVCDYFENREFFDDWRMFDGYDGIVLFQPEAQRPPAGTQRAIAEFCLAGGAAVVVGSFRMGERAEGLPPPAEPELLRLGGVPVQRLAYGAGAIYRVEFEALRRALNPAEVVRAALLDQMRYGAAKPPGGKPLVRSSAPVGPAFSAGRPEAPRVGPLFFGLVGALLLLCALAPAAAKRTRYGAGLAMPVVIGGSALIGALGLLQSQPRSLVEVWAVLNGEGDHSRPMTARAWLLPGEGAPAVLTLDLAEEPRLLARPFQMARGRHGWQLDAPLAHAQPGEYVQFADGQVAELPFRDFSARAYRTGSGYSSDQARLLEWWLEKNAYRGRRALLAGADWSPELPSALRDAEPRLRGAIFVRNQRD